MNVNFELHREPDRNLQRAIEPLASYICAADHPLEALRMALGLLLSEVNETNQAALKHFLRRQSDWLAEV
jgi:hypothetical protein